MMERVGELDGREILVNVRDDGAVEVLFEVVWYRVERGGQLAQGLLRALGDVGLVRTIGGVDYTVVAYNDRLDRVLVELIDLLVGIRMAHPRMVQLELELGEEEAAELEEALAG